MCLEERNIELEKREIGKEINFSFYISFWLWFLSCFFSIINIIMPQLSTTTLFYTNEKIASFFLSRSKVYIHAWKLSNETLSGIKTEENWKLKPVILHSLLEITWHIRLRFKKKLIFSIFKVNVKLCYYCERRS